MNSVEAFVKEMATRECEAAEFYGEHTMEPKCMDLNYNEETDPAKLELCDPCRARTLLRCPDCHMDVSVHERYGMCPVVVVPPSEPRCPYCKKRTDNKLGDGYACSACIKERHLPTMDSAYQNRRSEPQP